MQMQTETLRLQLKDSLQREANLKKINQTLMQVIQKKPQQIGQLTKQLQTLKIRHLSQINDIKRIHEENQYYLQRQLEQSKEKYCELQRDIYQRQSVLKILSLKIHQSQLTNKDYQSRIKQLQQVIDSQKILINNAKSNMKHHLALRENLQQTNRQKVQSQVSNKYRKILQQKQIQKENEIQQFRTAIDLLNAKIKLLEKQKEYLYKLEVNREKCMYK